jgi:hypothetical protein
MFHNPMRGFPHGPTPFWQVGRHSVLVTIALARVGSANVHVLDHLVPATDEQCGTIRKHD